MDLKEAINILEINGLISLNKLKKVYRASVKLNHPDVSIDKNKILKINEAYQFIRKFLENYELSVDEILEYENLETKTFNRFKNDWLGGNLDEK